MAVSVAALTVPPPMTEGAVVMEPNHWIDELDLEHHRKIIETVNSQLESMGLQRLHARTNQGLDLKVHATLVAVMTTNIN
jgi:hypothetical protein